MRALACRVCLGLLVVAGCARDVVAQDRPVVILDTDPAPAEIVDGTFFLSGGQVTMRVRNRHTSFVDLTLRVWVFDHDGRFKGTNSSCIPEPLERGTRRVISVILDVRDIASTDAAVVGVERAVSDRREWTMADSAETGVRVARQRASGFGGRLRLDERPNAGLPATPCPCECQSIAASCEAQCFEHGLRAFTCTPVTFEGCSASCSCK